MKLVEVEEQIRAIPGFKALYHRSEDFRKFDSSGKPIPGSGMQQVYTVFVQQNGVIKTIRVDVLVKNIGEANETAEPFTPLNQFDAPITPFRDELVSKVPAYQSAHPEIEKVVIDSVDEDKCMARVTAYEYDANSNIVSETKKIVYKVDGKLVIRDFKPFQTSQGV